MTKKKRYKRDRLVNDRFVQTGHWKTVAVRVIRRHGTAQISRARLIRVTQISRCHSDIRMPQHYPDGLHVSRLVQR